MRALTALGVLFISVAVPATGYGQAWTRGQGEGYVNVSVSTLSGDQLFGDDGELRDIPTYRQTIVGLYSELGLLDRWLTFTVNAELFRRNELVDQAATEGLGDLQLGLWSGIIEAPFRLTVGVLLGVPTGDDSPSVDNSDEDLQLDAASLPTGDGEFDVTPTVIFGLSFGGGFWPLRHFATARAGYWVRTKGFADAFSYQLELGTQVPVTFLDRFWLILRLRGVESFIDRDAPLTASAQASAAGLGNGVSFTTISAELYGRIWGKLGASVGYDTAFQARRIIGAAPIRFAISYEF